MASTPDLATPATSKPATRPTYSACACAATDSSSTISTRSVIGHPPAG